MKPVKALLAAVALAGAQSVCGEGLRVQPATYETFTELSAGTARETVSNQPRDWTESQIEVLHQFGVRKVLIGRLAETERFGLRDTAASISGYHPLAKGTTLYGEIQASDTHRVLPKTLGHVQLSQVLGGGFAATGGLKQVRYDQSTIGIADLTLEYYFSDFRIAATALPSHSNTAGRAASYRLQGGYYYGDRNNVQLVVASGEEVDRPIAVGTILKTSVSSVALFGRHWFARDWAFTYTLARTQLGSSRHDAAGLGIRYRF